MISVSTVGDTNHPNLYMYDQCKYSGCKHQPTQTSRSMISVSTLGVNTNHPNLYMYDQCKYSVGVNTNHPNLYMYDQFKYSGVNINQPNLYMYDQYKYSGYKHQLSKPLHV